MSVETPGWLTGAIAAAVYLTVGYCLAILLIVLFDPDAHRGLPAADINEPRLLTWAAVTAVLWPLVLAWVAAAAIYTAVQNLVDRLTTGGRP